MSPLLLTVLLTAPDAERVVVLDARVVDLPGASSSAITHQIAAGFAGRSGWDAITFADIDHLLALERDKHDLGCESDAACMSEIARATQTRLAVSCVVGPIGKSIVVNLALLDTSTASTLARASTVVTGVEALPAAFAGLLAELFGWQGAAATPRYALPDGGRVSIAVFELEANGVDPQTVKNVTQVLATQVKQIAGTSVISSADIDAMLGLQRQKLDLGCLDNPACMADIGGALGVDKLLVGNVGRLGATSVIALRLVDTKTVRVDSRVVESFSGQHEQLIPAVRHAARALLGVQAAEPGEILVVATDPGADVFIDEKPRGITPLPAITGLSPGRHVLRLAKSGHAPWHSDVYVDPGGTTSVRPELAALATWYENWWVWTAVAVVVGAGAVGWYAFSQDEARQGDAGAQTDLGTYPLD